MGKLDSVQGPLRETPKQSTAAATSQMSSEASQMLEAALQQMDGIISGKWVRVGAPPPSMRQGKAKWASFFPIGEKVISLPGGQRFRLAATSKRNGATHDYFVGAFKTFVMQIEKWYAQAAAEARWLSAVLPIRSLEVCADNERIGNLSAI